MANIPNRVRLEAVQPPEVPPTEVIIDANPAQACYDAIAHFESIEMEARGQATKYAQLAGQYAEKASQARRNIDIWRLAATRLEDLPTQPKGE